MSARNPVIGVVVFCVAMSTLLLQLVQTRIFGVVYWNHLVYLIVSIALLGFGISGTWLAFGKDTWLARTLTLHKAAWGYLISALVSTLILPRLGINLSEFFEGTAQIRLLFTYAVAVMPYFFGGWILASIFRDYTKSIHFLYFLDLVGAGLGCLLYVLLMQPLGAINLVLLSVALVFIPIAGSAISSHQFAGIGFIGVLVVLASLSSHEGEINQSIVPEKDKAFNQNWANLEEGDEAIIEYSEWNTISRIDVVTTKNNPDHHRIYIDGDAWTGVTTREENTFPPYAPSSEYMLNNSMPYILHRDMENVLIIGAGGGSDVRNALRAGAQHIDAVEINPTTYEIGLNALADANQGLYHLPEVSLFNEEGRSFIRRSPILYDTIMLHGIDTFAALNAGAYVLSENYLYTVEAFKDYISHLTPGGTLCVTRWMHPAEGPRLFAVALEALYELGIENPESCIVAASDDWMTVLVRNTPFPEEDIKKLRTEAIQSNGKIAFPPEPDAQGTELIVKDYAESRLANTQAAFLRDYIYDIAPVYDNSPFFFHYERLRYMLNILEEDGPGNLIRGHWSGMALYILLFLTLVVVVVFMFLPLRAHTSHSLTGHRRWLLYFACLGAGYMFMEITLMQRFGLLLGHPARSLALVLGTLLIASGVGSALTGKYNLSPARMLPLLFILIVLCAVAYPAIIQWALPMSLFARGLITVVLIAPLGLLMGVPFPSGMIRVSESDERAVPWMWGVNGGASVLGSIVAILLAINFGFTQVLLLAGLIYLGAAYLFRTAE